MSDLSEFLNRYKSYHLPQELLLLDAQNPRLREEDLGKPQDELLRIMKEQFDLNELVFSISQNGYFQEEPLIIIPEKKEELEGFITSKTTPTEFRDWVVSKKVKFVVVEGNRRLSTAILLGNPSKQAELGIRSWPKLTKGVEASLAVLPVIVYPDRKSVANYLGIRHIGGLKKWEPYEKARYVKGLIEEQGVDLDLVQKMVGDKGNSIRKSYLCFQLIQIIAQEYDLPETTENAKERFSYLLLSIGQRSVKDFIGVAANYGDIDFKQPVPNEKKDDLKSLFSWLFGEGSKVPPVVTESRDITNYLSHVLKSPDATEWLRSTRNLIDAYERSDGEKELLRKYAIKAENELGNIVKAINDDLVDPEFLELLGRIDDQVVKIKKLVPRK